MNESLKITLTIGQLRRLVKGCLEESKDRLIDKLPNLDAGQKNEMKKFFRRNPSLENHFDWNKLNSITYDSFRALADNYPEPIDPDTVMEFSDKRNEGNGIVSYEVDDTKKGQRAVRRIVDTHWGKDANPWCLIQTDEYGLTDFADRCWESYDKLPKRIAFKNGKLLAFMATGGLDLFNGWNELHPQIGFSNSVADVFSEAFPEWVENHYEIPEGYEKQALIAFEKQLNATNELEGAFSDSPNIPLTPELRKRILQATRDMIMGGIKVEWWDRNDNSHPNLDWAR